MADDCGEFRLDKPGPWGIPDKSKPAAEWKDVMQEIPVLDQGQTGLCYAYTASQLVDAFYGQKQKTSAIAAAVFARADDWGFSRWLRKNSIGNLVDGGWTCQTIDALKEKGACPMSLVDTDYLRRTIAAYSNDIKEVVKFAKNNPEQYQCVKVNELIPDQLSEMIKLGDKLEDYNNMQTLELMIKNGCREQLTSLPEKLECHDFVARVDYKTEVMPKMNISATDVAAKKYKAKINQLFSRPAPLQPLGLAFCSSILTGNKDCGLHAAMIIGRRKKTSTGKCQYLIRNSWGTDCSNYKRGVKCENGNLWVDDNELEQNMTKINYLELKK